MEQRPIHPHIPRQRGVHFVNSGERTLHFMRTSLTGTRTGPAPQPRRRAVAVLGTLALLLAGLLGLSQTAGTASADASDYTQSVAQTSSTQAQVTFTPTTASDYVIIHYLVNSTNQQNVQMTAAGSSWNYTVGGLSTGAVLTYSFTYTKGGLQNDSSQFSFTQGGTPPPGTVATPSFSPGGGSFTSAQSVTISDATSGAVIHYTTNGSTPTASSATYGGAINVASTTTLQAIAVKSGSTDSAVASATYTIGSTPATCPVQSDTPNFGSNVHVFDPSMGNAAIQSQLDAQFNQMKDTQTAQFSENRVADLFKPGTYSVEDNVGFYTSVAGLGQNPDDVTINGDVTVDAFNASDAGNATQNFWRSAENLAINPANGTDRWAVAQAAPFRRIDVHGNLALYPASLRLRQRRLHRRHQGHRPGVLDLAAAVVHPGQQPGQLGGRRVEHGLLRRERRPGQHLPEPAGDHPGHHPGLPRRARTSTSTAPASTTCSCRACAPTPPARAGRAAAPRAPRCR